MFNDLLAEFFAQVEARPLGEARPARVAWSDHADEVMADIDATRLWQRLMSLAEIGATAGGGVDRQALTAGKRTPGGLSSAGPGKPVLWHPPTMRPTCS